MNKELIQKLDLLANTLESKGFLKQAMDIDDVSRSLVALDLGTNKLDKTLGENPALKGAPVLSINDAVSTLKGMTKEELDAAVNILYNPDEAEALVAKCASYDERTAADNRLMENLRAVGSVLKNVNVKLMLIAPMLADMGLSAANILNSLITDGLAAPNTLLQITYGVNKAINLLAEALKNDGLIDIREAEQLAPVLIETFGKLGINIQKDKLVNLLQRIDFTSKFINKLEALPQLS